MFFDEWNVLIVDDEPDVLAVTRLALKDVTVYGLPIKIHTARSKAEAIEKLNTTLALPGAAEGACAVAFIDVVMETDHAGLELCDHIRNTAHNYSTQLFIRTGQPGVAPERKVIDDYDISGYFTKLEMTEQKLYTFVKSGIRQWFSIWYARLIADSTNEMVTKSASRAQLVGALTFIGEEGPQEGEPVSGIVFEDEYFLSDYQPAQLRALRDELAPLPPAIQTPEGHSLTTDARGRVLVRILEGPSTANYYYVSESPMVMPRPLLDITFRNGLVLSTLWKRAAADLDQLPPELAKQIKRA
jgi:CheY-like chemotaxis protein